MLSNTEIKKRLNNLVGQQLSNINLSIALLYDKTKCLKNQVKNIKTYVNYKIVNTPTGTWAKLYINGNPTQFRLSLEAKDGRYIIKNVLDNKSKHKILWTIYDERRDWTKSIVGYKNKNNNKIISKENYNNMIEREIKDGWDNLDDEAKKDYYNSFFQYRYSILNNPDHDFIPLTEIIIDENDDIEKYEPCEVMHWLEILAIEFNTTIYEIAKKSNIPQSTLYSLISNYTAIENITLLTLNAICQSLGITFNEFMQKYKNRFFIN